jgi:hypothetical protein
LTTRYIKTVYISHQYIRIWELARSRWLTPIIPAIQEAEIGRMLVPGKKFVTLHIHRKSTRWHASVTSATVGSLK